MHGLWPNYLHGGWPQFCNASSHLDPHQFADLEALMRDVWPSLTTGEALSA